MKNIFEKEVTQELIERIQKLTPNTAPKWGKMSVSQMLAHCCVLYETVYTTKHPKPSFFTRFILKTFVKKSVVGTKPYPKNSKTLALFIISDEKKIEEEKKRLIHFILKTEKLGADYFNGKSSYSFGKLTSKEWSNSFYKHLDHHLTQFGV